MALDEAFETFACSHEQLKAVSNLLSLRCRSFRCLGVVAGAIATDHTPLRMAAKPRFDCGTSAILEQIHDLVGLQIDDYRPIGLAFTKRKIIQPNLGWFRKNRWLLPAQLPTQRRDRCGQMQTARQPLCRFMSGGHTYGQQRRAKPLSHARSRQQEEGKAFGKNAPPAVLPATEEASGPQLDAHCIVATGNITNRSVIATVLRR
jgi:hypothetical protein